MAESAETTQNERVSIEPIRKLLRMVSPNREADLDALLDEVKPVFKLNRDSERNLFRACLGDPNTITMGLKCSVRLQVHAYAASVFVTAIGTRGDLPETEKYRRFEPAGGFLNWAVGVDFTRWLKQRGVELQPGHVLRSEEADPPNDLLRTLSKPQVILGEGMFRYACAWILLHELAHLKFRHTYEEGYPSVEQEKEADRFAAQWMLDAASASSSNVESDRLGALLSIAVALIWLTVFNVYFGPKRAKTHPEGYDRLYQVLDQVIDRSNQEEYLMVWHFVKTMLLSHLWSAGYDFNDVDAIHLEGDPRECVNHLIDRISKFERKK